MRYNSQRLKKRLWRTGIYVLLLILSTAYLMPFLRTLSTSLKKQQAVFSYPPQLIPEEFHFENYVKAMTMYPWLTFFKNSVIITLMGIIGTLISSSLVAFGFARLRFPGRDVLFFVLLATMMVPYYTTLIPRYILFRKLGWVNTLLPLWVPNFFGSPFFIFLLRQFFRGIPREIDEAARIDGCNTFQIFYKIYLPLAKPALITVAILQFNAAWGDFFGPLIYLQSQSKYTLTLGLNSFRGMCFTYWNYLCAATILISIPSIVFFFIGQKRIIGGITISGFK